MKKDILTAMAEEAAEKATAIGKTCRYRGTEYEAAAKEAARLNDLVVNEFCSQVETAPAPMVRDPDMRCKGRKTWAKAVRALFKDLGIKGVSVTAPNYSMAQSIHIKTPDVSHGYHQGAYRDCPRCQRLYAAKHALERMILTAYPDLKDQSDYQSDYFDYCLSMR